MGASPDKTGNVARGADPGTCPRPLARRPDYLLTNFAGCASATSAPTTRQPDNM